MKSTLFVTALVFFLFSSQTALAATYAVHTSSNWTTVAPAIPNNCSNCIINIDAGVTLTLNSGSCQTCTFNGPGIIKYNSSFNLWAPNTFSNTTLQVTSNMVCQQCTFTNDSIYVTSAKFDFQNSPNSITGCHVIFTGTASSDAQNVAATVSVFSFAGASSFSPSGTSFTSDLSQFYFSGSSSFRPSTLVTFRDNSVLSLSGSASSLATGSAFSLQNSSLIMTNSASIISSGALSFQNSSVSMSNSASLSNNNSITFKSSSLKTDNSASIAASGPLDINGSTVAMNGSSTLASSSSLIVESGSNFALNASSTLNSSGTNTIETNSQIIIGDGTGTSTAKMSTGGSAVTIKDNSMIKISNSNNSYVSTAASPAYTYSSGVPAIPSTSYSTANKTFNCGGTYPNACNVKTVFGCATFNGSGPAACTVLAVAELDLSAAGTGAGNVTLSWTDAQNADADHYLVQRSTGYAAWSTLGSVLAGGYTAGDYHYDDASTPGGTVSYRIARIGKDGSTLYSRVSSLTLAGVTPSIRIWPNPITGHTFLMTVPSTGETLVNIFTMTGQFLGHNSLKGQTQYTLQLPSQASAGAAVLVQVIGQAGTQSFPVLVR